MDLNSLAGRQQVTESKLGELHPVGGGDPIPLLKKTLLIGRRETCDIVLRFSFVSAHHCELVLEAGYWYVRDLKSRNGIKVNGIRVSEKLLEPGETLSVSKQRYKIEYSPYDIGAEGPPPIDESVANIFNTSLLEAAGLNTKKPPRLGASDTSIDIDDLSDELIDAIVIDDEILEGILVEDEISLDLSNVSEADINEDVPLEEDEVSNDSEDSADQDS